MYSRLRKKFLLLFEDIKKCTIGAIHPSQGQFYAIEIVGKHGEEISVLLDLNFKLIDIILKVIPADRIFAQQSGGFRKCSKRFLNKVHPYLRGKEYKKFLDC